MSSMTLVGLVNIMHDIKADYRVGLHHTRSEFRTHGPLSRYPKKSPTHDQFIKYEEKASFKC